MFDSFRVTRERALTQPELINGKRGLFGPATAKVADDVAKDGVEDVAAKAGKKTWGQRLKSLALNTAVGGVAAVAGTSIYEQMNTHSKALGEPGPQPQTTDTSATTGPGSTTPDPGYGTTNPNYGTTYPNYGTNGPSYGTTGPGYGTTGPGSATTSPGSTSTGPYYTGTDSGYTDTSSGSTSTGPYYTSTTSSGYGSATTNPSTSGTPTTRAIAERAREEHALNHKLPEDIFSESSIPSYV